MYPHIGRLVLPKPMNLADYETEPISIVQKSFAYQGEPLEIVLMDKGSNPKQYTKAELQNKLLFHPG